MASNRWRRRNMSGAFAFAGANDAIEYGEGSHRHHCCPPTIHQHLRAMRNRLEAALRQRFPELVVHAAPAERLPNTLSAAIPGVDARQLLSRLDGVATAAGAACHTGEQEPSRVLRAMGVSDAIALCTLRLTVGRGTTPDEIDSAAAQIAEAAE